MDRALDRGSSVDNDGNTHEQEEPPLDGSTPEGQSTKEAAQAFQSILAPDQEDSGKAGGVNSEDEERVACADLAKQGRELIRKEYEKRHGAPTEAECQYQKSHQGSHPGSLLNSGAFLYDACVHDDLPFFMC